MKLRNLFIKCLSLMMVICFCTAAIGIINVSAAELDPRVIGVSIHANKREVAMGDTFNLTLNLNIDDEAASGVLSFVAAIKFDPELITPVNPTTKEDVTGNASDYIVMGSSLEEGCEITAEMDAGGNILHLEYFDTSTRDTSIYRDGSVAKFAFRANEGVEINNSTLCGLQLINCQFFGRNVLEYDEAGNIVKSESIQFTTETTDCSLKITPKFKAPNIKDSIRHGETMIASHTTTLPDDAELLAELIGPDGDVVATANAEISGKVYDVRFDITEDYAPGKYKLKLSYESTSITTDFTILSRTESEPPVDNTPTVPEEDEEDDDQTTEPDTDDSENTNTGITDPGNTGIPTDKTDVDDKADVDDKTDVDDKADVVYPSDVIGHWAEENVKYVYDNGLMTGYEDGTFGAENNITRAEFVTVMARLLGLEQNADAVAFEDCAGHWAKGYIGALANAGIVGGVSETEFAPDSNITREQMAVILSRAFNLEEPFDSMAVFMDDEQISDWAYSDVYKVLNAGYMKGDDSGSFAPLANATRAEVATVIYRLHSQM